MILGTTIALSLQVVDTARRAAARASEMRYAEVQLRALSDAATTSIGYQTGRTDRFAWKVSLTPAGGGDNAALRTCAKLVELQSMDSGRSYRLATAIPCPPTGSNP